MPIKIITFLFLSSLLFLSGCQTSSSQGNIGNVQSYAIPTVEAEWIRNGQPIVFTGELWYPADDVESLLDVEVTPLGEYKGVQFFIEKTDVRPYDRLYTKLGRNKFRYFEKE